MGNNDGKLTCNSGKKNICFCGGVVSGFSSGNTHVDFQVVNGTFYNGSDFVKGIPFFGISLNAGEHAEIQIFICLGGTSFGGGRAGCVTIADILAFYHMNFGANPFDAVITSLFVSNTAILHGKGRVIWTGGITVFIVPNFFESAFISGIVRNQCL